MNKHLFLSSLMFIGSVFSEIHVEMVEEGIPWRNLIGIAARDPIKGSAPHYSVEAPKWQGVARVNRSYTNGTGFSTDGEYPLKTLDKKRAVALLERFSWVFLQAGYDNGDLVSSHTFYENNYRQLSDSDYVCDWKANVKELATQMKEVIAEVRSVSSNKVYWELGNEVGGPKESALIYEWVTTREGGKLPYPYPYQRAWPERYPSLAESPNLYNDYKGKACWGDRGSIGYLVEYFLAPAIDEILKVNETILNPEDKIVIMAPNYVGGNGGADANPPTSSLGGNAETSWIGVLMNYKIKGYRVKSDGDFEIDRPLVSDRVRGKTIRELVDEMAVHYTINSPGVEGKKLSGEVRVKELFKSFVDMEGVLGVFKPLQGIWHTEESGNRADDQNLSAIKAIIGFAKCHHVWGNRTYDGSSVSYQGGGTSSLIFYNTGLKKNFFGTSIYDGMNVITQYLPCDQSVRPVPATLSGLLPISALSSDFELQALRAGRNWKRRGYFLSSAIASENGINRIKQFRLPGVQVDFSKPMKISYWVPTQSESVNGEQPLPLDGISNDEVTNEVIVTLPDMRDLEAIVTNNTSVPTGEGVDLNKPTQSVITLFFTKK